MRDFRRKLALGAKRVYHIHQNVWSTEKTTAVENHGEDAQLDAILYTLANP